VSVSHVVLRYLREGPAHGYGLHKQITQLRHYYPLSNVNIYAVLRELEDLGWAESVSQIHGSRMRRVYRMTDAGRKEFSDWLSRPPEDDRHSAKDPIALKLLMLSADEPIDLSWMEDCVREIDEEIALTREYLDLPKDRSPLVVLTLQ
jgi:DNA-binding PadR family transcriptional regulator